MLQKCSTILFSLLLTSIATFAVSPPRASKPDIYTRILQLEDARSLGNGELETLLQHPLAEVRFRAALALGRIGDKRATPALLKALAAARTSQLRLTTVFALGEMEDTQAVPALLEVLQQKNETVEVRARAVEALGKIASLTPNVAALGPEKMERIGQALIAQLPAPDLVLTPGSKQLGWLTITALMRVKPAAAVEPLARQLKARDAGLRAGAANALARWGQPPNSTVPALIELLADHDIDVRANSARALGQSKAPEALGPLAMLLEDPSDRAQVGAVRALVTLADQRASIPLLALGEQLLRQYQQVKAQGIARPPQINLLLEVVAALSSFKDKYTLPFLRQLRAATGAGAYPEIENALLSLGEEEFWQDLAAQTLVLGEASKAANLIAVLGGLRSERAQAALLKVVEQAEQNQLNERVNGALVAALNRAKLPCPAAFARRQLEAKNPAIRAQAAGLFTELNDENFSALARAFEQSKGSTMIQARLGILTAIAKYKTPTAANLLKTALNDATPRIQRRAAELLGQGVQLPAETVFPRYTAADYARVRRLQGQRVLVTVYTSKGQVRAELFAHEAPMTVDSFIELARRDFFNGSPFHRVVPNFVAQGGSDPRNTGGPGYQLRCEINLRLHQRGSLSMAHAGKDTGSSQFTFQHSPQPHLDGGYTVFGQVLTGMDVVDRLTREDVIERIQVNVR